uniref:PARP-type domain-containing protein n=1 Tax=Mycena chlorophos TaxID=658473 RepID=A0ABQ0L531_MYCCL|nr:predicted protein [Mycena chlorophos]
MDEYNEKTQGYRVEYAASGRSICKGPKPCKGSFIGKGELRFGALFSMPKIGDVFAWRHWGCVTKRVLNNVKAIHPNAEELDGYNELADEDKKRVRVAWGAGEVEDEDIPDTAREHGQGADSDDYTAPPRKKKAGRKKKRAAKKKANEDSDAEAASTLMEGFEAGAQAYEKPKPLPKTKARKVKQEEVVDSDVASGVPVKEEELERQTKMGTEAEETVAVGGVMNGDVEDEKGKKRAPATRKRAAKVKKEEEDEAQVAMDVDEKPKKKAAQKKRAVKKENVNDEVANEDTTDAPEGTSKKRKQPPRKASAASKKKAKLAAEGAE